MAGNKNPWRDIVTPAEWTSITNSASPLRRARVGGHRGAPPPVVGGFIRGVVSPARRLEAFENELAVYDGIAKDNSASFAARSQSLQRIATCAQSYTTSIQNGYTPGAKGGGGKQADSQIDVWIGSIGRRALKKAAYLDLMAQWHLNAKAKYRDRVQLSMYLRGLAGGNERALGEKVHAVPYATIEKFDPLHRQTFAMVDDTDPNYDQGLNPMGQAMIEYLAGNAASLVRPATNPNATFYEWLEHHPLCMGTPVVTPTAINYKNVVNRVTYGNHDLGFVYVNQLQMSYERIRSAPGVIKVLNTTDFPASGKGHPGAVAFVWDADQNLWIHEHGSDGFVHASAKQGRKIRCSGMLNVVNGKMTIVTNESGHYQPTSLQIYHFVDWLRGKRCIAANGRVEIKHDDGYSTKGVFGTGAYFDYFDKQGAQRPNNERLYSTAKPLHIP